MCTQCYLVTSKSNKIFMLCIYIQLCTVLRKAKQDDCELLVGLLPPRVREKVKTLSSTNLHVAIFGSCFCLLFRYPDRSFQISREEEGTSRFLFPDLSRKDRSDSASRVLFPRLNQSINKLYLPSNLQRSTQVLISSSLRAVSLLFQIQ